MTLLTIFTPTYNRVDKLEKIYRSLCKQNFKSFEWLIVDDGSTDQTEDLIFNFISERKIDINYFKKSNGGKHTAFNFAVEKAKGNLFFCVDSDDYISDTCVQNIIEIIQSENFNGGVIAYKSNEEGMLLSDTFPKGIRYSNMLELELDFKCKGEFSLVIPTQILKQSLFPVFENEKFITESVIYDKISNNCKFIILDKILTICEYQPDGYTNNLNELMKKNPTGFTLYFMQRIDLQRDTFSKIMVIGKYRAFKMFSRNNLIKYEGKHKILERFFSPLGIFFYFYYRICRGF